MKTTSVVRELRCAAGGKAYCGVAERRMSSVASQVVSAVAMKSGERAWVTFAGKRLSFRQFRVIWLQAPNGFNGLDCFPCSRGGGNPEEDFYFGVAVGS